MDESLEDVCRRVLPLGGEAARDRQQGQDEHEPSKEHGQAQREVEPRSVGVDSGEGAAVVLRGARVGV